MQHGMHGRLRAEHAQLPASVLHCLVRHLGQRRRLQAGSGPQRAARVDGKARGGGIAGRAVVVVVVVVFAWRVQGKR